MLEQLNMKGHQIKEVQQAILANYKPPKREGKFPGNFFEFSTEAFVLSNAQTTKWKLLKYEMQVSVTEISMTLAVLFQQSIQVGETGQSRGQHITYTFSTHYMLHT